MNNELAIVDNRSDTLVDIRLNPKQYPRIKDYAPEQAVFLMAKVVTNAMMYRGQQVEPENVRFIATGLIDEILQEQTFGTKNISFVEVNRAVKKAVLTTDMYGISIATLYRVIIDYVKGEGHQAQKEADEIHKRQEQENMKQSAAMAMLQAYSAALIKNNR